MLSDAILATLVLALLSGHTPAQARVLTVDDDGAGAQFMSIQQAVDEASSGDVVVIRSGDYAEFSLIGKGISIVADEGAAVQVLATPSSITTLVSGIPAGQRAYIRGITFVPQTGIDDNLVRVENSAGVVWLEDVALTRTPLPSFYTLNQTEALKIVDSDQVVLVNSQVQGVDGAAPGLGLEFGSVGLTTENSTVFVHGGRIRAGLTIVMGGTGLTGMRVKGGVVVLRDVEVLAASGGTSGLFGRPPSPGNGGPAITISEGGVVWAINADLVGGPGGTGIFTSEVGNPGAPALIVSGTMFESMGDAALLTTTAVARVGGEARFDLLTAPDSTVFLLIRLFGSAPVFVGGLPGFLGAGADPLIAALGTTDELGQLSVELGIPPLPPGWLTWDATVQMAVVTPVPRFELSNPSIFTVVADR